MHIVDYDIAEGAQWASLIQALVSRLDGVTRPQLRITAVSSRDGSRAVQETDRRLSAFASSLGQAFSFAHVRFEATTRERFRLVKGEAVVMNCILRSTTTTNRSSTISTVMFLSLAAARIVTLVEEEATEETEAVIDQQGGFVGRFMGELRRDSAAWDSPEAGFPMQER